MTFSGFTWVLLKRRRVIILYVWLVSKHFNKFCLLLDVQRKQSHHMQKKFYLFFLIVSIDYKINNNPVCNSAKSAIRQSTVELKWKEENFLPGTREDTEGRWVSGVYPDLRYSLGPIYPVKQEPNIWEISG